MVCERVSVRVWWYVRAQVLTELPHSVLLCMYTYSYLHSFMYLIACDLLIETMCYMLIYAINYLCHCYVQYSHVSIYV